MGLLVVSVAHAEVRTHADEERRFLREARTFMRELSRESRRDAERIQEAYGPLAASVTLSNRDSVIRALSDGVLTRLPMDAHRFNVQPRLTGSHPIGEKDLPHQTSYLAAHPGALGCLLHVAARVGTSIEVTSLVRHLEYQRVLERTNPNARTLLPVHAIGVAFDISILNVPLSTARRLRDVLRHMRADGDLFFIAETRQLVFHVVPTPQRLSFYSAVFEGLTALPDPLDDHVVWTPAIPAGLLPVSELGTYETAALRLATWWPLGLVGVGIVFKRAIRYP